MNKGITVPTILAVLLGIALITLHSAIVYKKEQDMKCNEAGGYIVQGGCIKKEAVIKLN